LAKEVSMAARTTTTKKADPFQTIAVKAYERFLSRGGEHGYDVEDWLVAESEVVNGARPKRVVSKPRITTKAKTATKTAKKS
jgi:hypothetical protein